MATRIGHFKVVYPPGTLRATPRISRNAKIFMILDGEEIELAGVRGVILNARFDDVDIVNLEMLGTVEVVYADEEG